MSVPARPLVAADLLKSDHPLHNAFTASCKAKGVEPTKRQAAKYLQRFKGFRRAA